MSSSAARQGSQAGGQTAAAAQSASANRVPSGSAKRLTLGATILGSSIAILDSSVVGVALPSIQRSLGGGLAGQQWVSNAYLLTLGSFILLGGSLGDIFGERRGVALGGAASGGPPCSGRWRRRSGCWWRFARFRESPVRC